MSSFGAQLTPWVVFRHGRKKQKQTFYSVSERCEEQRHIAEMHRVLFCTSFGSWSLLKDCDSGDIFLLDLISMERIRLPPLECSAFISIISLVPTDSDSLIYIFSLISPHLFTCRPGDDAWIKREYQIELAREDDRISQIVCCRGKIYFLTCYWELGTFELEPYPAIRLLRVQKPKSRYWQGLSYCMVGLREDLYLVEMLSFGLTDELQTLNVFKMDFVRMIWDEVESIDGNAFFLGVAVTTRTDQGHEFDTVKQSLSLSPDEASQVRGDHIYFVTGNGKTLQEFDMKNRIFSTYWPCPGVKGPCEPPDWVALDSHRFLVK